MPEERSVDVSLAELTPLINYIQREGYPTDHVKFQITQRGIRFRVNGKAWSVEMGQVRREGHG